MAVHQRPRDGHALLLSAGQLGRKVRNTVSEPNQIQRLTRALVTFRLADLGVERRQFNVLQRRGTGQQIEALKNEADLAVANGCQFFFGQARDFDAFQQVASRRRLSRHPKCS